MREEIALTRSFCFMNAPRKNSFLSHTDSRELDMYLNEGRQSEKAKKNLILLSINLFLTNPKTLGAPQSSTRFYIARR